MGFNFFFFFVLLVPLSARFAIIDVYAAILLQTDPVCRRIGSVVLLSLRDSAADNQF